jgi:peptidoglycan/xylan/chitin deacetylase (PgdA/CDA1 family)
MPLASRKSLPILALAVGSWVGLGSPFGGDAMHVVHAFGVAAPSVGASTAAPVVPAPRQQHADVPPVDPSLLPDPTPWPQLNPTESINRAWLLAEGPAAVPGNGRRYVTFTFDDGPFPETTPVVLRVLAKHGVRATFFWIGRYLDGDSPRAVATRETAKAVDAAGHFVGNHTHDHERLTVLTRAEQIAQIDDGATAIERVIGKRPVLFRPPYGQVDAYSQELLRQRGQTLVLWSVEVGDMKREDPQGMVDSLTDQIEYGGGGIVLLHDIRFTSADALDKVLVWLYAHRYDPNRPERVGYEVVDLPEYLRATAASPQPYASRNDLERARAASWRKLHPNAGVPAALISDEPLM